MNLLSKVVSKYRSTPQQVKASFWFVICGFLQRAISLLTTPIFSRFLTTSEYGIFSVYHTWQDIIIIFASLNLALGVYLRGLIKYEDDQEEFTESLQSLYLINFFIVFGIYLLFHKSWNIIFELPTVYVCLMFADMMFQVSFQFWSARQRVKFYYKSLVSLTIFHSIVTPICSIIAVTYGKNRVSARICVSVLTDVVFFGPLFVKMFWHKDKIISRKYWKYALAYNLPLIPHYLSQILLNQSDRVMINNMVGASKAGIYSLAYSAAAILTIVNQSILNSYNPWMYQKIRDGEYKNIGKVSYTLLCIVAALNIILMICAPEIIAIMAPPSYNEAIWVIPPVAMSVYFMFMYSLFANFEFYYEKTHFMMIASVSGAILNIVLNYIFIRIYGFIAAGFTTLACYIFYCVAHYLVMKHILRTALPHYVIYNMKTISLITGVFVVLGFSSLILYSYPVERYALILLTITTCVIFRNRLKMCLMTMALLKNNPNK